jgi:hypothetical protein
MGDKQQTTNTSEQTKDPWAPQIPYLTQAFGNASNIYNQGAGNLYNGPQVAQFNPGQLATFNAMMGYGNNGAPAASTGAAGNTLTSAGTNGVTSALDHLASFKPGGGTQSNIDAATAYANNPAISDMVDAAMRDSRQNASENVLPQIARNAQAGGNINSNRTAIQNGIVERGLNQQAGDISSNLRGQAFNHGLDLAEQNSEAGDNSMLNAFAALSSGGNNAATTGVNANTASIGQRGSLFDIANAGGAGQQAADQAGIDNSKAVNQYSTDRLNAMLQAMFGVVGGTGYGGTSTGSGTSTVEKQPGALSLASAGLGTLGSFMLPGIGGASAGGNLYNFLNGGKLV